MTTATRTRPSAQTPQRRQWATAAWWTGLLTSALLAWLVLGTPPTGAARLPADVGWPLTLGPVAVAAGGLLVVGYRLHERLNWPLVLLAGYLLSAGWTLALAAASGALWMPAQTPSAQPLPGRLLAGLAESGVDGTPATALVCLVGALAAPLVTVALKSQCDELTARRLLPVLALSPLALAGANVEAVALALGAATLAAAVAASQPGRPGFSRLMLALLCGVLLGTAAMFGYSAVLLATAAICVFFVRRRPLLNVATGLAFFGPLLLARSAGLDWTADLAAALRTEPVEQQYLSGATAAVLALLLLGGPALVASLRSVRTTPAWPFLVGGGSVVVAGILAGLVSDGFTAGAWLPGLPWLLVAATAPERPGGLGAPTPSWLVALGALSAYAVVLVAQAG